MTDETSTGLSSGTQPTGITTGGGGESIDTSGIGGSQDTDTGLDFGPGQSTTTGTLPTQSGPNMDGPVDLDTSIHADDPRNEKAHHTTPRVTNGDLG
ncbi:hypothetical protein EON82_01325 [bacterium]|nr:MAG: hypothetical protein EON82_01325 [bacterium]